MTYGLLVLLTLGCHTGGSGKDGTDTTTDPPSETDTTPGTDTPADTPTDTPAASYHPDGYMDPAVHGLEAKLQDQACTACHGDDLTGGELAPSCDTCHADGWRTNCTFCHGEEADGTGAPPLHIRGTDEGTAASFIPHRAHTTDTTLHAAFDCTTCHVKPTDVLSVGHLFLGDTTPGIAETDFSGGLSTAARWNATNGSCASLYCHGNGRADNGGINHDDAISGCTQCHAGPGQIARAFTMSGEHSTHMLQGIKCSECHEATVDATNTVIDITKHVNGTKDIQLRAGMTYASGRCTGSCHGENHSGRTW